MRKKDTVIEKNNEKDNSKSLKECIQLENNDIKKKSQTCVNPSQKNNEQNNIIEKKTEENKNLIEKINGEKKELEKKIEEKKIEEKNNIIQQIFKGFIDIYNTINSIGSIIQPLDNNQNMDMNNIIKQISNDGINNINIVNNIFKTISNNIYYELSKIRHYIMNNLNNNNINKNIMNNVNNDNNKINKKTEYTENQKKREKDRILTLIQSNTEFKPKKIKNLPYSCILRQDIKYQDISCDNLNQK